MRAHGALVLLLLTPALLLLPLVAVGQTAPKWNQPPDLTPNGVDVNSSNTYLTADDFLCTDSGPILEVRVWGSWYDDKVGQPTFTLSFHQDISANDSPTGFSMPGKTLWYREFTPAQYEASLYAADISEGWMTPPADYQYPADTQCWMYVFTIDPADAFIQEEGTVYWLDVKADPGVPGYLFGWKSSTEHWNDDATWVEAADPYSGLWNELRYPPGHQQAGQSMDLAFVLYGPPPRDYGDAPDPPYPTYEASGGASHVIVPNVLMGATVDPEPDGQADPNALGDDNDGNDDDDGVVFVTPIQTYDFSDVEVTVSVDGYLSAWLDFDQDGDWNSVFDEIYSGPVTAGTNSISFYAPIQAVTGTTKARFRFCTAGTLPPDGPADDGEVEDYEVEVVEGVFGKWSQEPDIYPTGYDINASHGMLLADDFPCNQHSLVTRIVIYGSWIGDYLPFGSDPGAVTFHLSFHSDIPDSESSTGFSMPGEPLWWRQFDPGTFTVEVDTSGIREGWLYPPEQYFFPADTVCWKYTFDVPYDEAFEQLGTMEQRIVYWLDVQADPLDGQATFGWKVSAYHYNDNAVWTVGSEPYSGPWSELVNPPGHEFEGFPVHMAFDLYFSYPPLQDMGDAPDPGYPTLLASDGARHDIVSGIALGDPYVDQEPQGQPVPPGTGDDTDVNDDEDGVSFLSVLGPGAESRVEVTATTGGFLDAWVDFGRDGSWAEPGDRIFGGLISGGSNVIPFTCPADTDSGLTYARFRFNTFGSVEPFGRARDGEVEDYGVFLSGTTAAPDGTAPRVFALFQSTPNPFSRSAEIRFDLPASERVSLTVFSVDGRRVTTLVDRRLPAGRHSAVWDGRDGRGRPVAAGIYYYRLRAGGFEQTRKLLLLR